MEDQKLVYMDHAATTAVHPEVVKAMIPYLHNHFGNPSSIYSIAREAKEAIDSARAKVALSLKTKPDEIFFTSGGTESDNWAIKGVAFANRRRGDHIITSKIEHHAVLHTCQYLEKQGFSVTYLPVDQYGLVDPVELERSITDRTTLVSVMYANNEIGTIEPVKELASITHEYGAYFHTDAVQAVGHMPVPVDGTEIDLLSLSGHKFNGPKGTGALYIRKGVRIDNILHGGAQERNRRAGTENLAGIVGMGKAIELATTGLEEKGARIRAMRDRLISGIQELIPHTRLNGHPSKRLPGNLNISFEFIEGESMLLLLDSFGICASTGSACTSGSLEPSHVLLATGMPAEIAHGSLRLTLDVENTDEEVKYVLRTLPKVVSRLRDMSPLGKQAT
ncbi:MAG: cysteine desulfurase NifS [Methanoregulaceae archaeon]|jgi:cysteine desulfurase|nr:cysteine desulfurase NifS [Methanoregulaceae archaeon]